MYVTNVAPGPVVTNVSKNALLGDGSKFGVTDSLIANGMSVKRYMKVLEYHEGIMQFPPFEDVLS